MSILNFGSLNLDHTYEIARFPQPGETYSAKSYTKYCGGKGLNQSIALSKAGVKVYHAGAVGSDGACLIKKLADNGVDVRYIKTRNSTSTGHAIIQVDANGQNCIMLFAGANHTITESFVHETLADFGAEDWLVLQSEVNDIDFIIRCAAGKGMKIVWNPSPVDKQYESIDTSAIHMLILNEIEAEKIAGGKEADAQLFALRKKFLNAELILTLGDKGCAVLAPDSQQVYRQGAFPVEVVDTTAAGDTFLGYYVAMRYQGETIPEAACIASKAASLAIGIPGAADSIPVIANIK